MVRDQVLQLRATAEQRQLIDQAAEADLAWMLVANGSDCKHPQLFHKYLFLSGSHGEGAIRIAQRPGSPCALFLLRFTFRRQSL